MKLTRQISLLIALVALTSCGSSKNTISPPAIVVDSKAAVADTIATGQFVEPDTATIDTVGSDTLYDESAPVDTMPFVEATASWKREIADGLDNILDDALLTTSVCGLEVWDLDDDSCLYRHDELQRLRPASTLKVITAITALKELGENYEFTTRVYYMGREPDSARTWHGDIYIVGGMDPKISTADIASLASTIRRLAVDSIVGTIYADQSFKDSKKYGSGWCWDDNKNPLLLPLKIANRDRFVSNFITQLNRAGIYVAGSTGNRNVTGSPRLVAEVTRPLKSIMRPMLKNSNNSCAESVFYAMINHARGRGATARQGQDMERALMREAGVDKAASYDIVDGSGLSLYDYVSPHAEVLMLRYAYKHRKIYEALYPLLPVAARDGTLRKRMSGSLAAGNVHAKTGTVAGVRSLCGYLTARNGHRLAFSIINQGVNGDDGTANRARNMQDKICELLCTVSPSSRE